MKYDGMPRTGVATKRLTHVACKNKINVSEKRHNSTATEQK
jgi:hypothetical protein